MRLPSVLMPRLLIYSLLVATFALGLPLFHYVTALMIAVVMRHGRGPEGLLTRLGQKIPATS